MQLKTVPVLITWDVDPDRWTSIDRRQRALTMAIDLCEEFSIYSTFFFTANFVHEYPNQIHRIQMKDQEIGCHGLTHTDEEEYDRMPEEMQRVYLEKATRLLEESVNYPIRSFRGPRVKTSFTTMKILIELGYWSDSSVCSQRVDFLSSNLINPAWLIAPRVPYRPDRSNVFKRGESPIWEIPISALVAPFISGSLNVFGLNFMKFFFRLLYEEAKHTGKPIVYLSHPTDMLPSQVKRNPVKLNEFSLKSIRTHGFLFRRLFFRSNGEQMYHATQMLFTYMLSFPGVKFMTCSDYACYLNRN